MACSFGRLARQAGQGEGEARIFALRIMDQKGLQADISGAGIESLAGSGGVAMAFGADMQVALVNYGPVTIWIDSKSRE